MHKDSVHAGQAAYTPFTLALYDKAVLSLSCRWLWRCPASRLLEHYQTHISDNHLDVGVGSGYFLDKVRFPSEVPRLALMDLNADSLTFCERRVSRYQPEVLQRNVLAPIDYRGRVSIPSPLICCCIACPVTWATRPWHWITCCRF